MLYIARRIGKNPEPRRISLDLVEQQGRTIRQCRGDLGNASYLEIRICAHNATQRLQAIDLLYEAPQIDIAHTRHPDHPVAVISPKQPEVKVIFKKSRSNFGWMSRLD